MGVEKLTFNNIYMYDQEQYLCGCLFFLFKLFEMLLSAILQYTSQSGVIKLHVVLISF